MLKELLTSYKKSLQKFSTVNVIAMLRLRGKITGHKLVQTAMHAFVSMSGGVLHAHTSEEGTKTRCAYVWRPKFAEQIRIYVISVRV